MPTITVHLQFPNPFQAENIHRDVLHAARESGATATPVADGRMGLSLIEIVPQVVDIAQDGPIVVAVLNCIKSITDCLRVYKEAELTLKQEKRTATITPTMTDDEREELLRRLILDSSDITATITPTEPA